MFQIGDEAFPEGNFTHAQEGKAKNPSEPFSRNKIFLPVGKLAGKKRMKNHLCGKNSEISVRNRKRNVRGRTDGKMPERAGRNVRI